MPYISRTEQAKDLRNNLVLTLKSPGAINYLFTIEYVRMWENAPSYATFHAISRTIDRPETEEGVYALNRELKTIGWKDTDLVVARREAVAEFRRRVIADYEDSKFRDGSNVDPYEPILGKRPSNSPTVTGFGKEK